MVISSTAEIAGRAILTLLELNGIINSGGEGIRVLCMGAVRVLTILMGQVQKRLFFYS